MWYCFGCGSGYVLRCLEVRAAEIFRPVGTVRLVRDLMEVFDVGHLRFEVVLARRGNDFQVDSSARGNVWLVRGVVWC